MMRSWLFGVMLWSCWCGSGGAAEWLRWQPAAADTTATPDGPVLIYRPERVHCDNYIDVGAPAIPPGTPVTVSAEIKIPESLQTGAFLLRTIVFGAEGQVLCEFHSRPATRAAEWQNVTSTFVVPDGAATLLQRIVNSGTEPVWVRSLTMRSPTAEELELLPRFAGTDEEKMILHTFTSLSGGSPPIQTVLDYEHPAPGERYSLKIRWDNADGEPGLVDIGTPMPTPGAADRRLERVTFAIQPLRNTGQLTLIPVVVDGDINQAVTNYNWGELNFSRDYPAGPWYEFDYTMPEGRDLADPAFLLRLHGRGATTFRLSLPKFYFSDGSTATGFTVWDDPMALFPDWSERPFTTRLTSEGRVVTAALIAMTAAGGPETLLALQKIIPNFGIDTLENLHEGLRSRAWLEEHGIALGYQNIPPGLWQQALALDWDTLAFDPAGYQGINNNLHKYNAAHPAWRTVYEKMGERFQNYGIHEIMSIDCIFIFNGDACQYEPYYRDFLFGRDEGYQLDIDPADGGRHHFADYFRHYTGREPQPSDFGWADWDEYRITPETLVSRRDAPELLRKRGYLDMLLRHYAFLMYNSRAGAAFGRYGIDYYLMNNGDNWQNGNDWSFQVRSRDIPGFVEETFFYHPRGVFHAMRDAAAFRELYAATGTKHRLIQEVGQGGHGNPYWDPANTFALVATMCASTSYDSLQVDWPFESVMEVLRGNANAYTTPRYNQFISMALAYNLLRELGANRIPAATAEAVAFAETSALVGGSFGDRRLSAARDASGRQMSNANFNLFDLPFVQNARLLMNDCYALPVGGADQLITWFNAGPDRALVLTGITAGKVIDGTQWGAAWGWDQTRLNAPEQFTALIGAISGDGQRYEAARAPDAVLLRDAAGLPLLTRYDFPDHRRVYFYGGVPGNRPESDAAAQEAVLAAEFGEPEFVCSAGRTESFSYAFENGATLFALFSLEALEAFRMDDPRIRTLDCYNWEAPQVNNRLTVRLAPGDYWRFDFLSGQFREVTVPATGRLELELVGHAAELCFLLPRDRPELRQLLEARRQSWQDALR